MVAWYWLLWPFMLLGALGLFAMFWAHLAVTKKSKAEWAEYIKRRTSPR